MDKTMLHICFAILFFIGIVCTVSSKGSDVLSIVGQIYCVGGLILLAIAMAVK